MFKRLSLFTLAVCLLSLVVCASPSAKAEDAPDSKAADTPAALLPGHSLHGEVFNDGPRQKAHLMGGTGNVHIQITTKDPTAQQFFDQGLGQLHGFWYFESERSFRQAAFLDPDCAMAYWGMAMANFSNQKRSEGFIDHAVKLKDKVSRREQLWIDGLSGYIKGSKKDAKQRRTDYLRSLEDLGLEFPDELEAKALLCWAMWDSNGTVPLTSNQALDALIGEVLAVEPLHPVLHYRIHLWDVRKPAKAATAAALCGQGSPNIAHMWHMPGHTYWKLQRYADSAWQQEASARVDHAHMIEDRVMPYQIHNYAHNNEWLARSLSHIGRAHDAVALAKNLIEQPRHPQKNTLTSGASSYGRTRLLDTLTRYELWDELIALADTNYLDPTDQPDLQLKRLRALGQARFARGEVQQIYALITAIETFRDKAKAAQTKAGQDAEKKARDEKKTNEQIAKAKTDAESQHTSKVQQPENALAELNGYLALLTGNSTEALEQFAKAKDLSKETLSRLYAQAGDFVKAEQTAKQATDGAKNQVQPLANYADILWRTGKTDAARTAFKQLREMSSYIDADLPVMQRLAPIAKDLAIAGDWRNPPSMPSDVGKRPAIETLGPFGWHPSPSPTWELPDSSGNLVSLTEQRGRPIVLIFYLGSGCLHCVEQLKKFAPMHAEYEAAGITLMAVSSESVPDLAQSVASFGEPGEFPVRLLANQGLDVFRAYRAYDDFEDRPLHGTFLIDGKGLVRWQDISYQPFTDARFLLEESKRLLTLPTE